MLFDHIHVHMDMSRDDIRVFHILEKLGVNLEILLIPAILKAGELHFELCKLSQFLS